MSTFKTTITACLLGICSGSALAEQAAVPAPPVAAANREAQGVDVSQLPLVPAAELEEAKQSVAKTGGVDVPQTGLEAKGSSSEVTVKLGVNDVIPISLGHLNRIVTPFADPKVKTVSNITTTIKGPVVYVATTTKTPATMYITDGDDEDAAISLTLYPLAIPPHEIRLKVDNADYRPLVSLARAEKFERETPYVLSIKKSLRMLAKGEVPEGYQFFGEPDGDRILCRDNAFRIETGQRIEGASRIVYVGVATNISSARVELDERTCRMASGAPVLAVAAWPEVSLAPGAESEIYVVTARERRGRERVRRPSLLEVR